MPMDNKTPAPPQGTPPTSQPGILRAAIANAVQTPMGTGLAGALPTMAGTVPQLPRYQLGGLVGPGGQPQLPPGVSAPGAQDAQLLDPQSLEAEIQRVLTQQPQAVAQMKQMIQQAVDEGEITLDQLRMSVQMARVALKNPKMYPQLRTMAIQRGLADEQTLNPEYDPGYLFLIILAGEAALAEEAQPGPPMKDGGPLPEKSANADGSVPITAHEGEYVIPAHIVRAKGTEFFDKMLEQYNGGNAKDGGR